MDGRIHFKDMAFYAYHGHLAEENALGQRFLIELVLSLDMGEAARTDRLHDTVDYVAVFDLCRGIVEQERFKLLESLGGRILDRILETCPRVTRAEIIIKKPSVPIAGVISYIAVEAVKSRV